jgi:hypothetical protein
VPPGVGHPPDCAVGRRGIAVAHTAVTEAHSAAKSLLTQRIDSTIVVLARPCRLVYTFRTAAIVDEGHADETHAYHAVHRATRRHPPPATTPLPCALPTLNAHLPPSPERGVSFVACFLYLTHWFHVKADHGLRSPDSTDSAAKANPCRAVPAVMTRY